MILCIAEKPSVAKDIAKILGASNQHQGYYEGNGYQVTWVYGHLCTLKEPHEYYDNWKPWNLSQLPMIPNRFGIKLIDQESSKRQFKCIENLIASTDEIINCGDAGQEGELIQRWVMQKAGCKVPVKRLWISSLTDESIREGFKKLRPQSDFDPLYFAGLSRAIGDWILGMNATRLYTLKYGHDKQVLSIGRVQTPTLALIVQRQNEINNFVPENFWELKTTYRNVLFNCTKGRFNNITSCEDMLNVISNKPFTIKDVTTKKGKESAPRLFDLTSLQVECNKKIGLSAEDTLKTIQSLYEKKVTTYPRVDTTYLSEDIYPKIDGILRSMTAYASITEPVLSSKITKTKKIFDNSKVTDHHAIIPTNIAPTSLNDIEKKVYDMVALRFIAAFYPECEISTTTVMGAVDEIDFKAIGKQILKSGWRAVYSGESEEEQDKNEENIMPDFIINESGEHNPSILQKTTQPPKYFTEGTLLRAMETAGKLVDDEELRETMKENGIGRPSTRAAIIELLQKRNYIKKQKKNLIATETGISLISTIKTELLMSAKLTGIWENKLRKIERKEYDAAKFLEELKAMVNEIVITVLKDNSSVHISHSKEPKEKITRRKKVVKPINTDIVICPKCNIGQIIKGNNAYGCSNYKNGCTFHIPYTILPKEANIAQLKEIIQNTKDA